MWSALARGNACGSAEALENKKRRLVTDTITSLRMLVPNSGSPSIEIQTRRRREPPAESKHAISRLELHSPALKKLRVKGLGFRPPHQFTGRRQVSDLTHRLL